MKSWGPIQSRPSRCRYRTRSHGCSDECTRFLSLSLCTFRSGRIRIGSRRVQPVFFLIVKIMGARSGINNSGEKSVILEKGLACDDIMLPVCGRALS